MGKEASHYVGFGKYADKTFAWLYNNDPQYLENLRQYFPFYDKRKIHNVKTLIRKFKKNKLNSSDSRISIVDEVAEHFRQGKLISEIRTILKEKYNDLKEPELQALTSDGKRIVRDEFEKEKRSLIDIHILRYNDIYEERVRKAERISFPKKPHFEKLLKTDAYKTALDSLFSKERLLGIHTKTFRIEINRFFEIQESKNKIEYDFGLLTFEEKKELRDILRAATTTIELRTQSTNLYEEAEHFVGLRTQPATSVDYPVNLIPETLKEVNALKKTNVIDLTNQSEQESKNLHELHEDLQEKMRRKLYDFLNKKD